LGGRKRKQPGQFVDFSTEPVKGPFAYFLELIQIGIKVSEIWAIYDLSAVRALEASPFLLKKNLFWVESKMKQPAKFVDFRYRACKRSIRLFPPNYGKLVTKVSKIGAIYDLRRRACKSPILT
jgi:hypothetical protein